jgi:hypothetical protein
MLRVLRLTCENSILWHPNAYQASFQQSILLPFCILTLLELISHEGCSMATKSTGHSPHAAGLMLPVLSVILGHGQASQAWLPLCGLNEPSLHLTQVPSSSAEGSRPASQTAAGGHSTAHQPADLQRSA